MTETPDPEAIAANAEHIARTLAGPVPAEPIGPVPRWVLVLTSLGLFLFIPWIVYLAVTLPRRARADDYDIAWLGYDLAMWLVLLALAYCMYRGRRAVAILAAVAATMLVVDSWFDVVLSAEQDEFVLALVQALVVELPAAAVCLWIAINAERVRNQTYDGLRRRLQQARAFATGGSDPPGPGSAG